MSEHYHESTLDAALYYAGLGWAVFPTEGERNPARAKHPAAEIQRWSWASTTNTNQLVAWFSGSAYGVAVDCGKSNVVALDADRLNLVPAGLPLGNAWALRGNPERASFVFDQPKEKRIGCARGKWAAGEVKGDGGYICLPPSYHAVGGHYVWTDTSGDRRMPEDVRELLVVPDVEVDASAEWLTPGEMCAVVERAVDKRIALLMHVGVGRYPEMVGGTYELAALGAEGHEGVLQAMLLLREAYVLAVSERAAEARGEWDRAIRGLQVKGVSVEGSVVCGKGECEVQSHEVAEYEERVEKRIAQLRVDAEARRRIRVEDGEQWVAPLPTSLAALNLEDAVPNRIEGLLNANGTCLIVAQRKTGKTTTISNVVKSLCDGVPLFERYPTLPEMGKVGVLDLEMTPALLGAWFSRLNIQRQEALSVYSLRGKVGQTFSILNDDPVKFGAWLGQQGLTTLIIDPLAPLLVSLGIDEADNSGVRKFLTLIRDVASDAGVGELIMTHHSGWAEKGRSRGASSFEDAPDVIWRLQREGEYRLFSVIGRTQEIDPCPLTLREDGQLYLSPNEIQFGDF